MADPGDLAGSLARRAALVCEVCGATAVPAGRATSDTTGRDFALGRCEACGFAFVVEPRCDFAAIYDGDYYAGRGADPSVDYERELAGEPTVRGAEWAGIVSTVRRLHTGPIEPWLDFGCGYGTFVRYLGAHGIDAVGTDEGHAAARAAASGICVLDQAALDAIGPTGRFQVITAIEVLEHVLDPVAVLRRIAALLVPGGLLFVTTGNAARHAALDRWSYVVPDIHISYYEPRTLARAYEQAGLVPVEVGYGAGSTDILRFRILKGLRQRAPRRWHRYVPWAPVGRVVDRRVGLTAQPAGRRPPR
jgi:SAM-dependent methyltransferase